MKQDGMSVALKGIGLVGAAMALQYAGALAQWANEDRWPSAINWHIIIAVTGGAGFTALVSFTSGAYASWRSGKETNGNGKPVVPPTP